jgi:hypothetical protein
MDFYLLRKQKSFWKGSNQVHSLLDLVKEEQVHVLLLMLMQRKEMKVFIAVEFIILIVMKVTHTLIASEPGHGYKIEETSERTNRGRLFNYIGEIAETYNYLLQNPFKTEITRQRLFESI